MILLTSRLSLVPVADEHLDLFVALNADADVMRHILGRAATRQETLAEWEQRRLRQSDPERGLGYWAGFTGREFVGWFSASAFQGDESVSGLGYRLVRSAWGAGLATEGARAMVDQAFTAASVQRVLASTMAVNRPSRRVLEKAGLVHVDTFVGDWDEPVPGWEQGEVVYELTRDAWDGRTS